MRAVLQRVTEASVSVDEEVIAEIGPGLVVLLGIGPGDGDEQARALAEKVANLRIFADEAGRFNLSALDSSAEVLVVSQFTLYADTRRGRRPSFTEAALPDQAEPLIERFVGYLQVAGLRTATGRFGVNMLVKIWNDGPVTISLEV
ncbi:MAG: D-aminoacyl-tRNA deacylase [Dehalococcoidales bacterium]|nr:D-aminoacyl-tRNA deacylase [Dehalococcoidales bacterium]